MSVNLKTLVLNNNFMPVSVFPKLYTIPAEEALVRSLNGNCTVLYAYDRPVLTASRTDLYWPSVILNHNTKSFRKEVRLRKSTLYYRDHMQCVYCGNDVTMSEVTYDHVIPRKKGGKHCWENVVLSCTDCNSRKGHSDPVGRWQPKRKPYEPSFFELLEVRKREPVVIHDENWKQFLPDFTSYVLHEPEGVGMHEEVDSED